MWEGRVIRECRDNSTPRERQRSRTPIRTRTPRESDTRRLCFYHSKYKNYARKCKRTESGDRCQWGTTSRPGKTTHKRKGSQNPGAYEEKRRKTDDKPDGTPEAKNGPKEDEKATHRAKETASCQQKQSQVLAALKELQEKH